MGTGKCLCPFFVGCGMDGNVRVGGNSGRDEGELVHKAKKTCETMSCRSNSLGGCVYPEKVCSL